MITSIYRDKHEKKIATAYEPKKLHVGRAIYSPLIFISFTILTLIDQSIMTFFTACAYQLAYSLFYKDDILELFLNQKVSMDKWVEILTSQGKLAIGWRDIAKMLGLTRFLPAAQASNQQEARRSNIKFLFGLTGQLGKFINECWQ